MKGDIKKQAEGVVKEALKERSPTDKLILWFVSKVAYHVGFVYYYVKGIILRRW